MVCSSGMAALSSGMTRPDVDLGLDCEAFRMKPDDFRKRRQHDIRDPSTGSKSLLR